MIIVLSNFFYNYIYTYYIWNGSFDFFQTVQPTEPVTQWLIDRFNVRFRFENIGSNNQNREWHFMPIPLISVVKFRSKFPTERNGYFLVQKFRRSLCYYAFLYLKEWQILYVRLKGVSPIEVLGVVLYDQIIEGNFSTHWPIGDLTSSSNCSW